VAVFLLLLTDWITKPNAYLNSTCIIIIIYIYCGRFEIPNNV